MDFEAEILASKLGFEGRGYEEREGKKELKKSAYR